MRLVGPWCFTTRFNGGNYQGRVHVTATGKLCQRWDAQQPNTHSVVSGDIPDESLEDAANFCRNPGGHSLWPWCYTTTATRWEYCSIQDIVCRKYRGQSQVSEVNVECLLIKLDKIIYCFEIGPVARFPINF